MNINSSLVNHDIKIKPLNIEHRISILLDLDIIHDNGQKSHILECEIDASGIDNKNTNSVYYGPIRLYLDSYPNEILQENKIAEAIYSFLEEIDLYLYSYEIQNSINFVPYATDPNSKAHVPIHINQEITVKVRSQLKHDLETCKKLLNVKIEKPITELSDEELGNLGLDLSEYISTAAILSDSDYKEIY